MKEEAQVKNGSIRQDSFYLTCEKYYIFELLILAGGMMGAYTYNLRGGVFCNAQTANVLMMALAFGHGQWGRGLYYLIPFSAYLLGAMVSEALPTGIRRRNVLRWDTLLIGFEILVLLGLGFVPLSWPVQIVQVTINFICSMQYNTFRQAEGVPMATTFVTNHVRQTGVFAVTALRRHDAAAGRRALRHLLMIGMFFLGGLILTLVCEPLQERAVWVAALPLLVCFVILARADLGAEHELFDRKPQGH